MKEGITELDGQQFFVSACVVRTAFKIGLPPELTLYHQGILKANGFDIEKIIFTETDKFREMLPSFGIVFEEG